MSYERLEFLGDSILDLIIVPKLFAHPRKLKHSQMHNVHEALVNGLFLGYCCMEYSIGQGKYSVAQAGGGGLGIERSAKLLHLHDFLRAGGQVYKAKQVSIDAFEQLHGRTKQALTQGKEYPWCDLLAMSPLKFLSDLIESVIGALYIDTNGDLSVCEAFVEKLGIMEYMRTMLDTQMETMSPKERLGVAAGSTTVQYSVVSSVIEGDKSKRSFACSVVVGGEEVAAVQGCGNKAEAQARAALAAVKVLQVKLGATATGGGERKRKSDGAIGDRGGSRSKPMSDTEAMQLDSPLAEDFDEGGVVLKQ